MPGRHVVRVASAAGATVDGHRLAAAEQSQVMAAKSGINVGYSISDVSTRSGPEGTIVVTGRLSYAKDQAPHPVQLYSYELTGTITDPSGSPVKGAIVSTRTNDHKFWTFSRPTGANGKYTSFLVAADQEGDNPVPMTVAVSVGANAYTEPIVDSVNFAGLQSSALNIQLPANPGTTLAKSLFTDFVWAFEITAVLLVIAVVGGVALARRSGQRPGGPLPADRLDAGDRGSES